MVLASQKGRQDGNPLRTGGTRHARWRWAWIAAAAGIAVVFGIVMLGRDGSQGPPAALRTETTPQPTQVPPADINPVAPTNEDVVTEEQRSAKQTPAAHVNQQAAAASPPSTSLVSPVDPAPTPRVQAPSNNPLQSPVAGQTPPPGLTPSSPSLQPWSSTLASGLDMIDQGQLVEGRQVLSRVLLDHGAALSPSDAELIRQKLAEANRSLVFSSRIIPGDPFSTGYTIQQGDLLSRIAPGYKIPYQLIEYVNGVDARRIRVGQKIKLVRGPLHVEVTKSAYRMDVFLGDDPAQRVYVRSFTVGLGEDNSTPVGTWVVRRGGKLANPAWTNPRTGQFFDANDPNNPIGEYWIGLEGADDHTRGLAGYGIHGTIDLGSIGRSASMGCVRMQPQDIELVYNMLVEGYSTVTIKP